MNKQYPSWVVVILMLLAFLWGIVANHSAHACSRTEVIVQEKAFAHQTLPAAQVNGGKSFGRTSSAIGIMADSRHGCVVGATVYLEDPVILIASDVRGECLVAVYEHEQEHAKLAQAALEHFASVLRSGIQTSELDALIERVSDRLSAANASHDNPREYARLQRICRG